jgi:hypothetical protein
MLLMSLRTLCCDYVVEFRPITWGKAWSKSSKEGKWEENVKGMEH